MALSLYTSVAVGAGLESEISCDSVFTDGSSNNHQGEASGDVISGMSASYPAGQTGESSVPAWLKAVSS